MNTVTEKSLIENSKNKLDDFILEKLSNEMIEREQLFKKKQQDPEKENNLNYQTILIGDPEEIKTPLEITKHSRYKSLISKIPKESVDLNKYKINQSHKPALQNKSVDLENTSDLILSRNLLNYSKSPKDSKLQNKALYGYFFPNNYSNNQSFLNNNTNNVSGLFIY